MKNAAIVILTLNVFAVTGCHSAYVEATVHNGTGAQVTLLEVDYPSASFGKEVLAAGENFHYRFKILGDGGTKVLWTDTSQREHTVTGPQLREGQEGKLNIELEPGSAKWRFDAKPKP